MYNFQIKYIKGTDNMLADVMSRLVEKSVQAAFEIDTAKSTYDENIYAVMKLLQQGRLHERNPKELFEKNTEAKILWARREELVIKNSKLFLIKDNETERYIVPIQERERTVKTYHENHSHIGIQKTLSILKKRFFWPRMEETATVIINSCKLCSFNKQTTSRNKAPLISTQIGEPFERIAMDLTGPFTTTTTGNRYILGIIDHFSKICMLIPIRNAEAKTICKAFYAHWVSLFGAPIEIISDNGSSFKNNLKREFSNLMGIKEVFSMPYYPQANGLVERLFRTAKSMIHLSVNENKKEWDEVLPTISMALRNSVAQSTKYAPFEVIFGKRARLPVDWQFPEIENKITSRYETESEYIIDLRNKLKRTEEIVRRNLQMSILRQADYYNKNKLSQNINVGDLVLVRQTRSGKGKKKYHYDGPYEVVRKLGEWTYELQKRETEERIRRSYNQIKKYRIPAVSEYDVRKTNNNSMKEDQPNSFQRETLNQKVANAEEEVIHDETVQDAAEEVIHAETIQDAQEAKPSLRRSKREKKQPNRLGFPNISDYYQ
jgi:transposase InsO family protein